MLDFCLNTDTEKREDMKHSTKAFPLEIDPKDLNVKFNLSNLTALIEQTSTIFLHCSKPTESTVSTS